MPATFAALILVIGQPPCDGGGPVRVTVVVVLATSENTYVDPKLVDLAREVQKRNPSLTGFRVHASEAISIPVGESATFQLIDRQELKVKVERSKDENGRISLTLRPPGVEEVSYACACDKFFPIVTPRRTKKGETIILTVMAKPCTMKK